jgi:hypothetical protein
MEFLRRHKRVLLLSAVVLLYYPRFIKRPGGMTLYPLAADYMRHGESMATNFPEHDYPPAFAFVMIPFVPLPMWLRNLLWYAILVGATYLSFRLCEHLTVEAFSGQIQGRELGWLRFLSVTLSIKFMLAVFENQAYDVIVLLCVLVGLYGLVHRKDLCVSLGFAVGAALKATPLLFFPYLLLRRRGKLFLYGIVLYAGLSFLPDLFFTQKGASAGYCVSWLDHVLGGTLLKSTPTQELRDWGGANPLDQCLRSFVYGHTEGRIDRAHITEVFVVVYLVYLLVLFALLLRSAGMNSPVVDGSVLLVSMLMLSPTSSKSHFVVLLLPYMVLSAYVIKERRFRWPGGGILAVSFALNTLTSRDIIGSRLSDICLSAGCVTIGTLVLLVFLGYIIFTAPTDRTQP